MELKDVILSTLAEMEDVGTVNETTLPMKNIKTATDDEIDKEELAEEVTDIESKRDYFEDESSDNEMQFLSSMRERLLVLFEGFQAPNNTNIEAKVDMTLNFLEYILVTIDNRVQEIEKSSRK